MDASLPDENARLRALLQEQQSTIRKMAEYNRLLSQRVAAYASAISRLKVLVAKLQRMQFGKSSEKLREKTQRQVREAEERIDACRRRWHRTRGMAALRHRSYPGLAGEPGPRSAAMEVRPYLCLNVNTV